MILNLPHFLNRLTVANDEIIPTTWALVYGQAPWVSPQFLGSTDLASPLISSTDFISPSCISTLFPSIFITSSSVWEMGGSLWPRRLHGWCLLTAAFWWEILLLLVELYDLSYLSLLDSLTLCFFCAHCPYPCHSLFILTLLLPSL